MSYITLSKWGWWVCVPIIETLGYATSRMYRLLEGSLPFFVLSWLWLCVVFVIITTNSIRLSCLKRRRTRTGNIIRDMAPRSAYLRVYLNICFDFHSIEWSSLEASSPIWLLRIELRISFRSRIIYQILPRWNVVVTRSGYILFRSLSIYLAFSFCFPGLFPKIGIRQAGHRQNRICHTHHRLL